MEKDNQVIDFKEISKKIGAKVSFIPPIEFWATYNPREIANIQKNGLHVFEGTIEEDPQFIGGFYIKTSAPFSHFAGPLIRDQDKINSFQVKTV